MILAVDEDSVLTRLIFPNEHERWAQENVRREYITVHDPRRSDHVAAQLDAYFERRRFAFDLPLRPEGTPFQLKVWAALKTIPYGKTMTYKEIALQIGNLAAIRAVGRANGSNPIPIIIPCHRVIGADGSLTGFGGGLPLKQALLKLEGVQIGQPIIANRQPALL
jgi:methylated-DNA-[protein]-cysteine S-methyltransferase